MQSSASFSLFKLSLPSYKMLVLLLCIQNQLKLHNSLCLLFNTFDVPNTKKNAHILEIRLFVWMLCNRCIMAISMPINIFAIFIFTIAFVPSHFLWWKDYDHYSHIDNYIDNGNCKYTTDEFDFFIHHMQNYYLKMLFDANGNQWV